MEKNNALVMKIIPELQGVGLDEKTGEIVIYILGIKEESNSYEELKPALEKIYGYPVRIRFTPVRETVSAYARGGALTTDCTTGFAVKSKTTGTKGLLTAGHCQSSQAYANYGTPGQPGYETFPLFFVDEINDGSRDMQWHTLFPGNTPLGEIYAASDTTGRLISYRRIQADIYLDEDLCIRGKVSGYSCGKVVHKAWIPGNSCGDPPGSIPCNATWVRIEGPNLACAQGDSGGPVF